MTNGLWIITEFLIASLGVSTTLLSIYASYKFYKVNPKKNPLSRPISYTLIGEGVFGFFTTIFAVLALFGQYQFMPEFYASFLRVFMFSVAGFTTYKLV